MDINMESMLNANDSKGSIFPKPYSQDGLAPVTLKMLSECLSKK